MPLTVIGTDRLKALDVKLNFCDVKSMVELPELKDICPPDETTIVVPAVRESDVFADSDKEEAVLLTTKAPPDLISN